MKRRWLAFPVGVFLLSASVALAHASLVFGELSSQESLPDPTSGFTLNLHMMDPLRTPIEDAVVEAEFRLMTEAEVAVIESGRDSQEPAGVAQGIQAEDLDVPDGDWHTFRLEEVSRGGNYSSQIVLPEAGTYQLIMRDTTYPQEDAVAELTVRFDGESVFESALFIFPPTDVGSASLGTWLVWVVLIPVLSGVWVTIHTLFKKPSGEAKAPRN